MPILTEAETLTYFSTIKGDLKKSGLAFYVCELVDGLLADHQENRAVFDLLFRTLLDLEKDGDSRVLIAKFEQELLGHLGFWPKDRLYLEDPNAFIENIMERRIKTKRILPQIF